ncbi:hypothetical protein CCP4SC76_2460005 [Gammaproteobacteria bacterium]
MRYELRNAQNELVNTIVLDDTTQWPVPEGHTLTLLEDPEPAPQDPNQLRQSRKIDLAAIRFEYETSGITLDGNQIATDRQSQALINGAYSYSLIDPNLSIDWKANNGAWVALGASEVAGIALSVANHVQQCFSREKALCAALDAANSIEEINAVDLTAGWPE